MTDDLGSVAHQLALDAVTLEVVDAFAAHGIRAILLKGAAIADRLYEDVNQRPYGDVDLLVETRMVEQAHRTLAGLGFVNVLDGARADEIGGHATTWRRGSPLPTYVDLHTALRLCRDSPAEVWRELARDTRELQLGGKHPIEILSEPAQAFVIACHAVQHGGAGQPQTDLERALERFSPDTWELAGGIAERLHAEAVFAAGLRLTSRGRELLCAIGLDAVHATTETTLRLASPRGSRALLQLADARSLRERAIVFVRVAFPSPAYIRFWCQLETGRRLPLPLAYPYRSVLLVRRLPAALAAWRHARRRAPATRSTRAAPCRRRRCRWFPRRSG